MIEIKKMSMDSLDAQLLIQELNQSLVRITGDDGTIHFQQNDVEQQRAVFLVGYIDDVPYSCGALREINQECGEIKRIYARRNSVGMGHYMMRALEQQAIHYGYQALFLETRVQNEHAISFYEANGYVHCPNYGVYIENQNSYCFRVDIG